MMPSPARRLVALGWSTRRRDPGFARSMEETASYWTDHQRNGRHIRLPTDHKPRTPSEHVLEFDVLDMWTSVELVAAILSAIATALGGVVGSGLLETLKRLLEKRRTPDPAL